ncbi:MAG TPA: STAS domain-containing protein [Planctomycetaceae bacterium]|jgi:anti-anti-sigma factor|nr:STAS domain-containing protein [Planctomycetaceae bacterium]
MSRISDVFQVRETGRLSLVRVNPEGVTDFERFEQCRDELLTILKEAGCIVVRFDVEGIPFLASGVLGLVVSMRNAGVDIQIQNASEHVRDVLRITRLDQLVEVLPGHKAS